MSQKLTDAPEPLNALYHGDGGTGKTTHLAKMANLGKVLIVSAESGVKSRPLRLQGVKVQNIEVFPGKNEEITFDSLEAEWLRIREALNKNANAYVGVGWDSITEIHQNLLGQVVQEDIQKADRLGRERDPFLRTQENYGQMTEQVRQLMRKYRDLPCHFGVTALSRRMTDDDGAVTYLPAVTPALQQDLNLWVDMVCVTSVAIVNGEEEFRGLFAPHGKYRGKDRLNAVPKWLVDPTFDRLVGYATDKLTVEKDPVMKAAKARRDAAGSDPASTGEETETAQAA